MSNDEPISVDIAVEARVCGHYQKAVTILTAKHPETSTEPRLLLEYASLLAAQGLEHDRAVFLQGALERIKLQGSNESMPQSFVHLLELLLADAEYWAFGKWSLAVKAMRKAQGWLRTANANSLTDDEVPSRISITPFLD